MGDPAEVAAPAATAARRAPVLVRGTLIDRASPAGEGRGSQRPLQALVPSAATVGDLRRAFEQQLAGGGGEGLTIVVKGQLLTDDARSLADEGLLPTPERQIPHVHLCRRAAFHDDVAQQRREHSVHGAPPSAAAAGDFAPAPAAPAAAPAAPARPFLAEHLRPAPPPAAEAGPRVCRLCFDDEVTPDTGPLFSPCRCAGTMRFIHVNCLNMWRQRSQSQSSYYQCDQCGYRYNIERTKWAGAIIDRRTVISTTLVALVVMTVTAGLLTSPLGLHTYVWDFIDFRPLNFIGTKRCADEACDQVCNSWDLWNWEHNCHMAGCHCSLAPTSLQEGGCDIVSSGILVIGAYGLYAVRELLMHNWWIPAVALLSAGGGRHARVLIAVGVGHAYYTVSAIVHGRAKVIMTRWGEQIRSIDADPPPAGAPPPPADAPVVD